LCFSNKLNPYYYHKFPMKHFLHLNNFGQFVILCPFKPQIWHACENVLCVFWLGCVTFMVATMVCYFLFLHVSTLWFVIP
jgi:hypothetical protein